MRTKWTQLLLGTDYAMQNHIADVIGLGTKSFYFKLVTVGWRYARIPFQTNFAPYFNPDNI